ncbi:MAG TPA: hypothetical protein VLT86_10230 [Vicinamibacterales bacterium]|nr:hypothetical protein [Vicinamibacterales bacterium]
MKFRPALFGGLLVGVLSSVPFVSAGNLCCCLWVVSGGVLTAYLMQQEKPEPIEAGDAALGGLVAGLIGAVITVIIGQVLLSVTGPLVQDQIRRVLESNPDVPPEVKDMVGRFTTGGGIALLQLAIVLPVYAIFGLLGGLLGMAIFKKKVTPPQAPATPTA